MIHWHDYREEKVILFFKEIMNINPKRLTFLKRNKIAVLTTSSETKKPHSIFVEINKVTNKEIIITNNQMTTSKANILVNSQVCILSFNKNYECLNITWKAKYYNKGKYYDYVRKLRTNKSHNPKWAIVIKIDNVKESS